MAFDDAFGAGDDGDWWSDSSGGGLSPFDNYSTLLNLPGAKPVVSRTPIGNTGHAHVQYDDKSSEVQDRNGNIVPPSQVIGAMQSGAARQPGGSVGAGASSTIGPGTPGQQPAVSTRTPKTASDLPSWWTLMGMDKTLGSSDGQANTLPWYTDASFGLTGPGQSSTTGAVTGASAPPLGL